MAKFKTAFVAIILFFCLIQNGGAQQYEDQFSQSVGDWQPKRSRLRSKQATRSVAPSPEDTPNYSSPDLTTRNRQRTRGRNVLDPVADPRYDALDATEIQQRQFAQEPIPDFPRSRKDDFRNSQQRTNIKTLEDSLNTERYQKRLERPQNLRRNSFPDNAEPSRPTELRRNDDVGIESPPNRNQRPRARGAAERRIGASEDVGGEEVQSPTADAVATPPALRARGSFRGRTTFQGAPVASRSGEISKRGRTRTSASRYQNVDSTEAAVPYVVENADGRVSAAEFDRETSRTSSAGSQIQQFPPQQPQLVQQIPTQQPQLVQQFSVSGRLPQPGIGPVPADAQAQQIETNQAKGRNEAGFPNLSTQQFSTDASQFARINNVAPAIQQFPSGPSQQFLQQTQTQIPNFRVGTPTSDGPLQQIPTAKQFADRSGSPGSEPEPQQISRRIDGNELERTPQFIPVEAPKGRSIFRSRGRTSSAFSSAQTSETVTESSTQPYEAQQGRTRQGASRQGSFRSRTRAYAANDEPTSSAPPPPSRTRTPTGARQDDETRSASGNVFRGRSRSRSLEAKPTLEAKERAFEELPETEANEQANQAQLRSPSRPPKAFRGTVTAKATGTQSEEDGDATENYPKEFLEKLKSSKGFVPPPVRSRASQRADNEQTFTPTTFNAGTARLKRKQFTTETYPRRDSDTSESIKRESSTREENPEPENDKNPERATPRQTRERYSQRFYRKLAAKTSGGTGASSTPPAAAEPKKSDEAPRSRTPARKTFRSYSTTAKPSTTTEFEASTTEQLGGGEERRRFVPKKKISLEERKLRIAKLKEKLRQNATEGELATAESQESFVVKESLVVQANTHPGSREAFGPEELKTAVQAKSSASSNAKGPRGASPAGATKTQGVEGIAKYDLITLGSEENLRAAFPSAKEPSTTTKRPKATKAKATATAKAPSKTAREATPAAPETSASKPRAATQVPTSTTATPDFAVLNVTLFPSTRHRFSARINSSANIVLPPDVELITTTTPSVALNAPETTTSLGNQPDFTFSVNKLFNSSLTTTTTTTTYASVERATTDRNSFGTALFDPSTRSLFQSTTTQKSSTTTKGSSSKKKSSGRKKSKKTKSKTSGNATTTKKPATAKPNSTTKTPAATVRTAPVNSTGNASNNNSTGVRPLSLAFSDFEGIFNETMKVVNSNPMAGPLPGVVPRAELDALTPETILNGTGTEDATEGTTAKAANSSNANSVDNSTNQVESPGRLTSDVECINGTCTKSKSQAVHFNDDGSNDARAPLPYARRGGTTKSPETLRRIFIYGIFPNNTVQRKPFPGDDGPELSVRQYDANRYDSDRYRADRYNSDRYNADRYNSNRYNSDRYNADRYNADRYNADRYNSDRYRADRYNSDRYNSDRYNADRYNADRYNSDRYNAQRRPTTNIPPYTPGDYYVFGVYPNNSVVRRRGWKTFDYEKYHSPYVIFGIYPNNTIIKKYPNGTTIDDEFMVSDNEIRKTIPDVNAYRGCSCPDGARHHATTPNVQPAGSVTPSTMTSTTTTTTTTTTVAPEEPNVTEAEDSATESPPEPEETETEEPERNAKDDAENIDFGSENISETDKPQMGVSEENSTASSDATGSERGVEGEGEDEDDEEEESEEQTETTSEESSSPSSEVTESTTQSPQGNLAEAEGAELTTTQGTQEESTTRSSESLENAEEADDSSTPRNLEETTNSLEREETQNAKESGTDASPTESSVDGLADAEEADGARTTEGTEASANDGTTERSENIEEKAVEGEGGTTETNENAEAQTEENLPDADRNESLQESTTAKDERNGNVEESTEENSTREGTTERNALEEGTTEESERLVERTTETDPNPEGRNLTESPESERIRESTTQAGENSDEETTTRSENLSQRTTEESYNSDDKTTTSSDGLQDNSTEDAEKITESTTQRSENLEERTTESYLASSATTETENSGESTTRRNENLLESTTESYLADVATTEAENFGESTTRRSENLEERTTESYLADGATTEAENSGESTTRRSENLLESTTEENGRESLEERTTEGNESVGDSTTEEEEENSVERTTEDQDGFSDRLENLEDRTEEEGEDVGDSTTERSESSLESTTEENDYGDSQEYSDYSTTEESETSEESTEDYSFESTTESGESLQESTTERSDEYGDYDETDRSPEDRTTESEERSSEEPEEPSRELSEERTTESASAEEPVGDFPSTTEKPSAEENLIIDLNSDLGSGGDSAEGTSTEPSVEENTVSGGERLQNIKATTEAPASTEEGFEGYAYEKPTENPFDLEELFGSREKDETRTSTPPPDAVTETTEAGRDGETSTTDYDIDVRELGNLIGRFTTATFGDAASTDPAGTAGPDPATEVARAEGSDDVFLNALLPFSVEHVQESASGNPVKRRHRRAMDDLDEPSSLTNLAYRALSTSETTSSPIPVLTTTTTTTTTTTARATASSARPRPKKVKNLSKTSVTAYKNLTNLASTPLPDEVFIVTPVSSTRGHSDADYFKRGKVKFVTLTPGVVVTTNVRDENDVLTMSSQHVQKVTKAPAKIPDNFLSTVFGEIEEKASSPIPDILKNVQNDLQGDGLSASLARRIITLALEKAMTSTTPPITPQPITATTIPVAVDSIVTTPVPQTTASYVQRITTSEPMISTTAKKPTTTPGTTTTTAKTKTTTTKATTTKKPFSSSTTRRPRTTSTTTTESPQTILITPKKAAVQQANRNPAPAVTSPEFLGSTYGPEIGDGRPAVDVVVPGIDPLDASLSDPRSPTSTTTRPASQRVTEDLNALLSSLWQEQTSKASKPSETPSGSVEPKKKTSKSKSALSKQASASLSESDLKILEAILQQQGSGGATQDLEQIVQNQIRLAEEVRKASRNLKKKQQRTTTTTTERPPPLGLGFLLNLFGAGSRPNGLFSNDQRNARRPRPVLAPYVGLDNASSVTPDPFNELDEGSTTGERSARGELVSAAIDVTKAVSKFMGTVLTSAAQSFQNFFRSLGR